MITLKTNQREEVDLPAQKMVLKQKSQRKNLEKEVVQLVQKIQLKKNSFQD
jgi:hypothetical protein